jgi:diguanylate cyclase (GGDEF)-like protein
MTAFGMTASDGAPLRVAALLAAWTAVLVTASAFVGSPLPALTTVLAAVGGLGLYARFENGGGRRQVTVLRAEGSDPESALPSQAEADHFIAREFDAARRGRRVTLVMFGFSRFEEFSEREGMAAAGAALQEFGKLLNSMTRRMNLSARYGWRADAFLSVLSDADAAAAEAYVARVRDAMATSRVSLPEIEAGVVEYAAHIASPDEFVECAERALAAARAAAAGPTRPHGKRPTIISPLRSAAGSRSATADRAKTA